MELVPLVLLLVTALLLAALVGLGRRHDVVPRREWRLVQATRVLGLACGLVAAVWVSSRDDRLPYGLSTLLAPAVFGLVVVLGVAAGETVVRRRRDAGPRTASLEPRTVGAYLPRPTAVAVAGVGAVLLLTLAVTSLTASRTDDGHLRGLSCTRTDGSETVSPYPGAYYSVPLLALLALSVVVAALAAHRVVVRPPGLATTDHGDDVLRRRSLTVIVAAVGVAVGLSQTGIGWVTTSALLGLDTCRPAWAAPTAVALGVSAVLSLLVALWCLVRIVSNDSLERPWT
jgi:hypothetical protein